MNLPLKSPLIAEVLADACVSISNLKANPAAVIAEAQVRQVAILSRNKPVAYVVSPEVWEYLTQVVAEHRLLESARDALAEEGSDEKIDLDAFL